MQIKMTKDRSTIKNNVWKCSMMLFFMALVSVYSSFFMDKKIIKKHENEKYLQELKSSFVANKKRVNDLRNEIITRAQKKSFGFIEPNKKDVITLQK